MVSSAELVFLTVTSYLRVTQAACGPGSSPLVVFAVVGASSDVTVTVLEVFGANVTEAARSEWPFTVTLSTIVRFSPWTAWNVQETLVGMSPSEAQEDALPATMLPTVPAGQSGPEKPAAVK